MTFNWEGGDPDMGDSITYDIYLDSIDPPTTLLAGNQSNTTIDITSLQYDTIYYWRIVAWDSQGASTTGPIWEFTTKSPSGNQPPNTPNYLSPGNGSTGELPTVSIKWTGGDPDAGDTVTYQIFMGTTPTPPPIVVNQSDTKYTSGGLSYSTTYYWRIIAWDNHGASASGPLWHFTTTAKSNSPPNTPNIPFPTNGSINNDITLVLLTWTGGDPDAGDTVKYDVYFSTSNPPKTKVSANQSALAYNPGAMSYSTTYYWRIIAWDNNGASAIGPVWHFTTKPAPNNPPNIPNFPNPANKSTGIVLSKLQWSGGDPDAGDTVTYDVYFGMTTTPPKVSTNQSGTSYTPLGAGIGKTYYWRIIAWDNHGASAIGPLWNFKT
jgi:hypothetical protein